MTQKAQIPQEIAQSLIAVIEYLWDVEQEHFYTVRSPNHIYLDLERLTKWVGYNPDDLDEYEVDEAPS